MHLHWAFLCVHQPFLHSHLIVYHCLNIWINLSVNTLHKLFCQVEFDKFKKRIFCRTELLVVPDVSIPIKKKPPSLTSSDEHLTEAEDSDSENDEAFLPVAASVVVGQIEKNKINVSPTASLR